MARLHVFVWGLITPWLLGNASGDSLADLRAFRAAPVGQRLAALRHEPLRVARLKTGEWALLIHAPEQSAISNWDDETRVVLYRPGQGDFERTQFVTKAGQAVPGRTDDVEIYDLDQDGVEEIIIRGRPHGPVGKATVMIFRREQADARYYVVLRRRHLSPELKPVLAGVRLRYQQADGAAKEELFSWRGPELIPAKPGNRPIKWE
jgi:hypothetical protein